MKVYKTAKLEILGSHIIEPTIRIYREALFFVIDVCYKEKAGWLTLGGKNRLTQIEKVIKRRNLDQKANIGQNQEYKRW